MSPVGLGNTRISTNAREVFGHSRSNLSDFESNRLHVGIFRFHFHSFRVYSTIDFYKSIGKNSLKPPTSTGYFSNPTGSSATHCRFFLYIDLHRLCPIVSLDTGSRTHRTSLNEENRCSHPPGTRSLWLDGSHVVGLMRERNEQTHSPIWHCMECTQAEIRPKDS